MIADHYNQIADIYDGEYKDSQFQAEDLQTYKHIKEFYQEKGKTLDLACGTGESLLYLNTTPDLYCGVDLSKKMIEKAKIIHPGYKFLLGDMLEIPELEKWDNIFCIYGGAAYIPAIELTNKLRKLLAPNGTAFIHLPGGNRNRNTSTGRFEIENQIKLYDYRCTPIWETCFKTKVVKQNLFYQYKKKMTVSQYAKMLAIEERLPFSSRYYAWILLILRA